MNARIDTPFRECTGCHMTKPLDARHFAPRPERKAKFKSRCRACMNAQTKAVHVYRAPFMRRTATDPNRVSVKICSECCDLPWRRELSGCRKCRELHEPEPTLDVMDYVKRYVEPRGVM